MQLGEMEAVSNFCARVSAVLFIIANAYYPARVIARKFTTWTSETTLFFRRYMKAHITLNLIAFLALIVHAHWAEERNFILTSSAIVTVILTIEGVLMHFRVMPDSRKHLRLLHTQQALVILWIVLIVAGHHMV
ncbi:MAG: hypothetical protein HQL10_05500 [Nitrospirae bacterium]|nr:hypothetical protein [Nitrospirota bacterium]